MPAFQPYWGKPAVRNDRGDRGDVGIIRSPVRASILPDCFRSKAVWGYDPEFMALMPAALGVAGEDIAAGDVWVATGADGQIAGVVALAPGDAPGALDLNKLFIEPRHIRSGVGRALLAHAIAEARRRGAGRLTILADPSAAAFYERARGSVRRP